MNGNDDRKAGAAYQIAICVFVILFALFWCGVVAATGAWFMLIFGLFFLGISVFRLVMCIKALNKEKEKDRGSSTTRRETDPWNRPPHPTGTASSGSAFCPYCGAAVDSGFQFCPKCGRRLEQ